MGICIFEKIWGVFWVCSGHVVFASILKKNTGACSGRVVFASIFHKNSGACSGRVQCVPVCSVCCFYWPDVFAPSLKSLFSFFHCNHLGQKNQISILFWLFYETKKLDDIIDGPSFLEHFKKHVPSKIPTWSRCGHVVRDFESELKTRSN